VSVGDGSVATLIYFPRSTSGTRVPDPLRTFYGISVLRRLVMDLGACGLSSVSVVVPAACEAAVVDDLALAAKRLDVELTCSTELPDNWSGLASRVVLVHAAALLDQQDIRTLLESRGPLTLGTFETPKAGRGAGGVDGYGGVHEYVGVAVVDGADVLALADVGRCADWESAMSTVASSPVARPPSTVVLSRSGISSALRTSSVRCWLWSRHGPKPGDSVVDSVVTRRLSRRVTGLAIALRLSPNLISLLSLATVALAALVVATQGSLLSRVVAALLVLTATVLDCVDGEVARLADRATRSGAFLDSLLDRYADAVLVLGIALAIRHEVTPGTAIALTAAAVVGCIVISYMGSLSTQMGFRPGLVMRRDVRLYLLALGILSGQHLLTIVVLSVGCHLDAVIGFSRILWKDRAGIGGLWRAGDTNVRGQVKVTSVVDSGSGSSREEVE